MSQIDPLRVLPSHFSKIHFNIILLFRIEVSYDCHSRWDSCSIPEHGVLSFFCADLVCPVLEETLRLGLFIEGAILMMRNSQLFSVYETSGKMNTLNLYLRNGLYVSAVLMKCSLSRCFTSYWLFSRWSVALLKKEQFSRSSHSFTQSPNAWYFHFTSDLGGGSSKSKESCSFINYSISFSFLKHAVKRWRRCSFNISLFLRFLHGVWVCLADDVSELLVGSIFRGQVKRM